MYLRKSTDSITGHSSEYEEKRCRAGFVSDARTRIEAMQEQLHKNKDSKSVDIFPKQNEFQGSPLPASKNTTATNNKLRCTNIFSQTT
jgi:hypothetical protein